jgi:thiamine biosynthesis protein ThiS|tara:strand:+ start:156 stop:374 length:219 start_codon:yes stop_codon:yes gene_type:complete
MQKKNKIKIKLNGKKIQVNKGINLASLINKLKFPLNKIAIEKNNLIVEKKKIKRIFLKSNDKIEIVHFIGGG